MSKEKEEMHEKFKKIIDKLDNAEVNSRVLFRKECGKKLNEVSANVQIAFYRIAEKELKDFEYKKEDQVFLALCVHSLWDADVQPRLAMDFALLQLVKTSGKDNRAAIQKRAVQMMDTRWDNDGYLAEKIGRTAKMIKQKGFAVDGVSLMNDLFQWNYDSKPVQKRWANTLVNE